jgi:hypothetical protein
LFGFWITEIAERAEITEIIDGFCFGALQDCGFEKFLFWG